MDVLEPYYFEPNILETPKMIVVNKDSKVDNRLEKIYSVSLVKDAKSGAGFSP